MVIEAGEFGHADVTWISITGQSDGQNAVAMPARLTHQRVTGAVRQRNVADDDIDGRLGIEQFQSALQSIGSGNNVSPTGQQADKNLSGGPMIFYN